MSKFSPDELLKECNKFRKAGGAEKLTKLKPGMQRAPSGCLVARNLNFDCVIDYNKRNRRAYIASNDDRLLEVARQLYLERAVDFMSYATSGMVHIFELNNRFFDTALAFDNEEYDFTLYEA